MILAPDDHMIEEFSADRTDHAFDVAVLPRGAWRDGTIPYSHPVDGSLEGVTKFGVVISNQIRGHRAEVALARGELDVAAALITPLLETADDPEYRAIYAEILTARGDSKAASEAERAAGAYELLLARRPEAYADHAAAFFMGVGNRPQRAVELALANRKIRDTPRSRSLLAKALRKAPQVSLCRTGALVPDLEHAL